MKYFLVASMIISQVLAQVNMKLLSQHGALRGFSLFEVPTQSEFFAISRIMFFSGSSLILTFISYKFFTFSLLVVLQSAFYVLVPVAAWFVFDEKITLGKSISLLVIILGILYLFNSKLV